MRRGYAFAALALALSSPISGPAAAATEPLDTVPRTLVMTAFAPEWDALAPAVEQPQTFRFNGLTVLAGTLAGKPVLLMQSGVSMVNAAMNTQAALDRFRVRRIVFSGIAGGVDPKLSIGDVVVPAQWGQYLEVSFARQAGKRWLPPEPVDPQAPRNWGMMFPRGVRLGNEAEPAQRRYLLAADPQLLDLARKATATMSLRKCTAPAAGAKPACLAEAPRVVVGGTGVSAGVFADNAAFRRYLHAAWGARVVDMESAAVVQVAFANRTPAIVFRSLSDLAGGDIGQNRMNTFMALASVNSAQVVRTFLASLPD
jgi:adenosylhomocysteine nucleosidase